MTFNNLWQCFTLTQGQTHAISVHVRHKCCLRKKQWEREYISNHESSCFNLNMCKHNYQRKEILVSTPFVIRPIKVSPYWTSSRKATLANHTRNRTCASHHGWVLLLRRVNTRSPSHRGTHLKRRSFRKSIIMLNLNVKIGMEYLLQAFVWNMLPFYIDHIIF